VRARACVLGRMCPLKKPAKNSGLRVRHLTQPGQPPAPYGQAPQSPPYGQPQQPYGQQPYGAPQMGYPAAPGGVKPYNYLPWSIISIFLFWPTVIPAIINATKVDPAWQMGNARWPRSTPTRPRSSR
jgi:Interferon-induced transmembrane protein